MKFLFSILLSVFIIKFSFAIHTNPFVQISKNFLLDLKAKKNTDVYVMTYKNMPYDSLKNTLDTKDEKLAFWLNTYNGFIQYLLTKNPKLYDDKGTFFSQKKLYIAGLHLSFDDIEHGILRDSRIKLSLGYLPKLFPKKYEKNLRIKKRDYRIHFAANCGAKSCPPIAIYDNRTVNDKLSQISSLYLKEKTSIKNNIILTTPLISWFRGDFGNKRKRKELFITYKIVKEIKGKKIKYDSYDWSIDLGNYIEL